MRPNWVRLVQHSIPASGTRCLLLPRARLASEGGRSEVLMHQLDERPSRGNTASEISNAVVRLMSEYTGRGPTKAKTVISRDVVTVVLQDTLTKGERGLAANGKSDIVLSM